VIAVAALIVSVLALIFTVGSFWWMNARRGSIEIGRPGTYAFAASTLRLRLPLALYNTGATALIVTDIRFRPQSATDGEPYLWLATLSNLRPTEGEPRDFTTPFAVLGRSTVEIVAESEGSWCPVPGTERWMLIEAKLHPSGDWRVVGQFDWWAPPVGGDVSRYITYRNAEIQSLPSSRP
jgi:hypothetical protein